MNAVGLIQGFIGAGMIAGVVAGGLVADRIRSTHAVTVIFLVIAAAHTMLSVLMLYDRPGSWLAATGLALDLIVGAGAVFAVSPIVQTRLVAIAPHALNVALALNSSMIFLGQGLGTVIGGLVIGTFGLAHVGLAAAAVALVGAFLAVGSAHRPTEAHTSP